MKTMLTSREDDSAQNLTISGYCCSEGKKPGVKICGLQTEEDIEAVNDALPDYAGFVFDSTRRRYISPQDAGRLCKRLDGRITPVAVFVNASEQLLDEVIDQCGISVFQLHGNEDEAYIGLLRHRLPAVTIIKAFSVSQPEDLPGPLGSSADLVLLDHGTGGTGKPFDWSILTGFKKPYILAGGLHSDNVRQALGVTKPFAVDVSSGVETDGRKDRNKILRFVSVVRGTM